MSTYIISDTHFGHENLCRSLREMPSEESDALLIENWNKTVNKHDKVLLLGDVTMDKPEIIKRIIPQLHGFIHVLLGNHDTARCTKALIECGCKVSAYEKYKDIYFSHIPLDITQLRKYRGNIHGHIHMGEDVKLPAGPYYNVNCEFHNYTPILLDDAIKGLEEVKRNGIF